MLWSTDCRAYGLQYLWHTDLVAPRYVGSSGIKPMSPALAGGLLAIVPSGKSGTHILMTFLPLRGGA